MHEVPPPSLTLTQKFFDEIITDIENNPHNPPGTSTQIIRSCRNFVSDNYDLIRSAAELNGAIQSFIVRSISPETNTVDVMLSDFLKSNTARQALGSLMLQMPNWIGAYNQAVDHVTKTDYSANHVLPRALQEIEDESFRLNELPLWLLKNGARARAWLKVIDDKLEFGSLDSETDTFESIISIDRNSSLRELTSHPNFVRFSPGAVALVDIIRTKLHIPVIHGKTGHLYEAINEITNAILEKHEIPEGKLAYPKPSADISPISAISHPIKTTPYERAALSANLEKLNTELEKLKNEASKVNTEVGQLFQETTRILTAVYKEFGLDTKGKANKIPTDNPLSQIDKELSTLFLSPMTKTLKEAGKLNDTQSLLNIPTALHLISGQIGNENFTYLLQELGLQKVALLWSRLTDWNDKKEKLNSLSSIKNYLASSINEIKVEINSLEDMNGKDTPIIQAAIYGPQKIRAISRLERTRTSKKGNDKNDDNRPNGGGTPPPNIPKKPINPGFNIREAVELATYITAGVGNGLIQLTTEGLIGTINIAQETLRIGIQGIHFGAALLADSPELRPWVVGGILGIGSLAFPQITIPIGSLLVAYKAAQHIRNNEPSSEVPHLLSMEEKLEMKAQASRRRRLQREAQAEAKWAHKEALHQKRQQNLRTRSPKPSTIVSKPIVISKPEPVSNYEPNPEPILAYKPVVKEPKAKPERKVKPIKQEKLRVPKEPKQPRHIQSSLLSKTSDIKPQKEQISTPPINIPSKKDIPTRAEFNDAMRKLKDMAEEKGPDSEASRIIETIYSILPDPNTNRPGKARTKGHNALIRYAIKAAKDIVE